MSGFVYKSYNFVDKDPIIDYVRAVINESGETLKWIGEHSGVNPRTIAKWLYGDTKRPQTASVNAVLRTMGYKLEVMLVHIPSSIKPISQPKSNVVRLNKTKGRKRA